MAKQAKKTAKRTTKPSGRPKGSTTSDCQPVKATKPCCPKCGSSDLNRRQVIRDVQHLSEHQGVKTTRRRWTRTRCRCCGQWPVVIEDYNP